MKKIIVFSVFYVLILLFNVSIISSISANGETNEKWIEKEKLLPSDGEKWDFFGNSVSIDGDYAIVGMVGDDDNGEDSGSAYIFKRKSDDSWIQHQKLTPLNGTTDDRFGTSVDIDGDHAFIGATGDDEKGSESGCVYVFKLENSNWIQNQKITASNGEAGDWFGISVSIDGDTAVIGACRHKNNNINSGSAYIFERVGSNWSQKQMLIAEDAASGDSFGQSVSIDGDYTLINARPKEAAYIFKRTIDDTWIQDQKLTINDKEERFGQSISIDGNYALIGAFYRHDAKNDTGAAFVFKNEDDTWAQKAKLTPINEKINDLFGWGVSINGNFALISAPLDNEKGAAYVFKRDTDDSWIQDQKLTASDGEKPDSFGSYVSIVEGKAIISAQYDTDNGNLSGSAYIFEKIDDEEKNTCGGKTKTPGFELIFLIITIGIVLYSKRRKRYIK